jgi:hypothetical protein
MALFFCLFVPELKLRANLAQSGKMLAFFCIYEWGVRGLPLAANLPGSLGGINHARSEAGSMHLCVSCYITFGGYDGFYPVKMTTLCIL